MPLGIVGLSLPLLRADKVAHDNRDPAGAQKLRGREPAQPEGGRGSATARGRHRARAARRWCYQAQSESERGASGVAN